MRHPTALLLLMASLLMPGAVRAAEPPTEAEEQPGASEEQPAGSEEKPATSADQPAEQEQTPAPTDEQPAASDEQTAEQQQQEAAPQAPPAPKEPEPLDFWLTLRGCVCGYSGGLASLTSPGWSYGAAVGFNQWRYLGFELEYDGSRNGLQGRDGLLVRNSARALAKLFLGADPAFRAFLAAGLGAAYIFPTGAAKTVADNDLFLEIPLAFGVEWSRKPLVFGVRLGLTGLFGDSFAKRLAAEPPDGAFVNGTAVIGFGF